MVLPLHASQAKMIIQSDYGTFAASLILPPTIMKRIHGFSLLLGALIAIALISACQYWQKPKVDAPLPSTTQSQSIEVKTPFERNDSIPSIAYPSLPIEAQEVIRRIKMNGTFQFKQDGQTFQNREGILPRQTRGYYQEYTVITPKADNRGARRIVAGKGDTGDVATAGEFYYTFDHYRSFYRVKE